MFNTVSQLKVFVLLAGLFPNFGDPPEQPSQLRGKKVIRFFRKKKGIEALRWHLLAWGSKMD